MRNLKKFLALVLALMMAFSLMVTVNAANADPMSDLEDVTEELQEAVTVLNGMGIITGFENGEFRPQDPIRRVDVSALVYRLVTGDWQDSRSNLYSTYQKFSDVTSSYSWAAGYIGYCANQEIIKGVGGNRYAPESNVTGYQILAMVLRAVGYDQNGEFEGTDWQVRVASTATQLGILNNINSTSYAGTLGDPATRELVAEIIFQAAQLPMVRYELGYYNPYIGVASAQGSNILNDSLGIKYYGLTDVEAVVLGNQATGEEATILGTAGSVTKTYTDGKDYTVSWTEYDFPGTTISNTVDAEVPKLAVKYDTGVDLFGHKVKVWYNANSGSTKTAYAMFDCAKSDVIKATALTLTGATGDIAANLPDGWKVDNTNGVYQNDCFSKFNTNATTKVAKVTTVTATSPVKLYQIIDNDGDDVVDVVIALNIQTSKIIATNIVGSVKYTGVTTYGTDFLPSGNISTTEGRIADAALSSDSVKTLGDYEMGFQVKGTTPRTLSTAEASVFTSGSTAYFTLKKIDSYIDSKVLAVNPTTKALSLPEGKTVNMSIYYDTVVGGYSSSDGTTQSLGTIATLPQVKSNAYTNETYRIWLDEDGNYLGAQPIYAGNEFVYGTYVDVSSPMGSSSFTYQMVGVDMNGEIVTKTIETMVTDDDTKVGNNKATFPISAMDDVVGTSGLATPAELTNPVPHRDDTNSKNVEEGQYTGFAVTSTGTVYTALDGTTLATPMIKGDDAKLSWESTLKVDSAAAKLGVVKAATYDSSHNVYFTEKTKFIVVSGNGTDTVDAKVYNGISDLLGENAKVDFGNLDSAAVAANSKNNLVESTAFKQMIYFSSSDFVYAQDRDYAAINVDTVFIPAEALTPSDAGVNSLYYAGSADATLTDAADSTVKQYTLYVNGEKQSVWLSAAPTQDSFHTLAVSTKKTASGDTVYTPTAITTADDALKVDAVWVSGGAAYTARTWDTDTATIDTTLYRIAGDVKVVNVNKDNTGDNVVWPGIDSLATLNDASSLNATSTVKVNALLNKDGQLAVIYVCFAQS